MSSVQQLSVTDQVEDLPELPSCNLYSDEPSWKSDWHLQQIILLLECLNWWWQDRDDFYASANSTIYFSDKQLKSRTRLIAPLPQPLSPSFL